MNTVEKLNRIGEIGDQQNLLRLVKDEKINALMTPEIRAAIAAAEAEYDQAFETLRAEADTLTAEVYAEVMKEGATCTGDVYMAVYNKGREGSWDGSALKGYAAAHPEILAFRKPDGLPYVTLRRK